jgi:hypothetical protein
MGDGHRSRLVMPFVATVTLDRVMLDANHPEFCGSSYGQMTGMWSIWWTVRTTREWSIK